jgi:ornithine--oxo-acid transaminase
MLNSKQLLQLNEQYGAKNYKPLPIVISFAQGVWVEDPENNRYLDMLAAYSAMNHGHRHPKIIQALKDQADKVTLTSRAFENNVLPLFYKKLSEFTKKDLILPMNTGAEAVETAIKTARRWASDVKKIPENTSEIIVCYNNFHGRTTTIVSFSNDENARRGFGPFTPGFKAIPFGDSQALKEAINENTAAFLFEPIQGEAGINIPPVGYLKETYEICKEHNVLFIADEIQTGLGRTGKNFACDWEDVIPDIYILGKALGGGVYPISAVAANKEILGVFNPGSHGSTFGGNPLGAACAIAAIDVLIEEELVENSRILGEYFKNELNKIKSPMILDVRGKGLFIGLELNQAARPICEMLAKEGILCKDTKSNTIRFAPPLIITKEQLDYALDKIRNVIK